MTFNQLGALLRIQRNLINIQIHRSQDHRVARPISNMADQNGPITFNSRSKAPYNQLSNFYEAKIEMPEGVFASVEHYFHATKFIDKDHPRFEIHGDLGEQSHESGSWKPSVSKGRFIKSAGGKDGTKKYALTLRTGGLERMWAKQKMKEGLRKKFKAEPFRELLLKTGRRVLVHTPMRGKTDFWSGRVDKKDGQKIVGENNMGKLLMEVREELNEI
ncbi:uncharacterized protein LOC114525710 [Dendronephthya gigantea]|uniref:uncharacterized protein LOC114525710 n=1 Tax=Dendronephthya gigantea TaxID=151771 RepID=UPI00106B059F|nr:uncharacterized protein LOC114525710 [Dendronephthya gigantea]